MLLRSCSLGAAILLLSFQAGASVEFEYSLNSLGSNQYEYVYTIYNDGSLSDSNGSGLPVLDFDIAFDSSLYQNPTDVTPSPLSTHWNPQLLSAVGSVPVQYDYLALDLGIPANTDVGGFAVEFTWLGAGLPGSQQFQIYDPNTSNPETLLQSGQTAPEPSTLAMLIVALAYGAKKFRRRHTQAVTPAASV